MSFEGLRGFTSFSDADQVNMLNNEHAQNWHSNYAYLSDIALNDYPSAAENLAERLCDQPQETAGRRRANHRKSGTSKYARKPWTVTGPEDYADMHDANLTEGLESIHTQPGLVQTEAGEASASQVPRNDFIAPAQEMPSLPITLVVQFCGIQVKFHVQFGTTDGAPPVHQEGVEGHSLRRTLAGFLGRVADVLYADAAASQY